MGGGGRKWQTLQRKLFSFQICPHLAAWPGCPRLGSRCNRVSKLVRTRVSVFLIYLQGVSLVVNQLLRVHRAAFSSSVPPDSLSVIYLTSQANKLCQKEHRFSRNPGHEVVAAVAMRKTAIAVTFSFPQRAKPVS